MDQDNPIIVAFPDLRFLALTVVTGMTDEDLADHARAATPSAATAAGASHAVVGRGVTRTADPAAAFRLVRAGLRP
ncbi:orotidine 5'-phosphate decarboxylase / HUMPS family protein [Streptomyces durhamensis]|uniref:orotidine 5'-phosphate decarboxylase / HUMPS family protein n=1 Tax=Streptomyces durhamensis TaxID=68194 RepID=UPI0004CDB0F0|nr:orotidine 5'-phosphate decarboxylase / HUMPS family protein [Streptomyces durhamensis]